MMAPDFSVGEAGVRTLVFYECAKLTTMRCMYDVDLNGFAGIYSIFYFPTRKYISNYFNTSLLRIVS